MKKSDILKVVNLLEEKYGVDIPCFLNYTKDYELLIATILAAQCTDDVVNMVTKKLFKKVKSLSDYLKYSDKELALMVKSCTYPNAKAKNILKTVKMLLENFDGKVPSSMEDLTSLAGVGRKTANVIRTHIYKKPSVVVDTHVFRTSRLLGLASGKNADEVEKELMKKLPKDKWMNINPQLITLGRNICRARKKECESCFLNEYCDYYRKLKK